jgi:hypothetical protein
MKTTPWAKNVSLKQITPAPHQQALYIKKTSRKHRKNYYNIQQYLDKRPVRSHISRFLYKVSKTKLVKNQDLKFLSLY